MHHVASIKIEKVGREPEPAPQSGRWQDRDATERRITAAADRTVTTVAHVTITGATLEEVAAKAAKHLELVAE